MVRFLFGPSDIPRSVWKGKKMCLMAKFHKTNYLGNFLRKMLCDTGVPCSLYVRTSPVLMSYKWKYWICNVWVWITCSMCPQYVSAISPPLLSAEVLVSFQCSFWFGFCFSLRSRAARVVLTSPEMFLSGLWPLFARALGYPFFPMSSNPDSTDSVFHLHKVGVQKQLKWLYN